MMTPDTLTAPAMPPLPLTVEGASVLHQMMRFRRAAWRGLSPDARHRILSEATAAPRRAGTPAEGRQSAIFSLLGHKGDLMLVHFRRSFEELNQAELDIARLDSATTWSPPGPTSRSSNSGSTNPPSKVYAGLAQGHRAAFRRVESGDRSHAGAPAPGHGAAALAGDSASEISLLLSHGPQARRVQKLVPAIRWPTASA